ncbi:hypothetical protein DVH24_001201 [Malus domestica]|uniref:Protein kinase domain-containing protein n=1 Tax=Malus domestica TaxID=3750 RepID=A0A498K0Q5_MALDO|nr:hypothetical protein DVH24_001201 [Malus domestica]
MHRNGYFHRDLKPANVLVNDGARVVMIADLGSAIQSTSLLVHILLLRCCFSQACMVLRSICGQWEPSWQSFFIPASISRSSVIGSPTWESWPEGQLLAQNLNYQFPQLHGVGLPAMIPSASRSAIQLISSLCSWDPSARPTADEVLRHPFFVGNYKIPRAIP